MNGQQDGGTSTSNILRITDVWANYGPAPAVRGVSLNVAAQEIVAVLGANGAGKSTTLKTISGLLRPRRGRVEFDGRTVTGHRPESLVREGLCLVPEGARVFAPLSVMDNLVLGAYTVKGRTRAPLFLQRLDEVFQLFPVLSRNQRRVSGSLSGGEQQMLAIGRALMSSPRLLLLDEPSLGLAPVLIQELMQRIADMRELGLSVLLVEQNANAALKIADRGYVMEGGKIRVEGSSCDLLENQEVRALYLGDSPNRGVEPASE